MSSHRGTADVHSARIQRIIECIKASPQESDDIEFWNIVLMDHYKYKGRPIHSWKSNLPISELTVGENRMTKNILLLCSSKAGVSVHR